jgi:RimJ/RimL family protein N-acetyltransferase
MLFCTPRTTLLVPGVQLSMIRLEDRAEIEKILRRDAALHACELGDLDDFHWPDTAWHADPLRRWVVLIYAGGTVMLFVNEDEREAGELLRSVSAELPDRFIGHFTTGLAGKLAADFRQEPSGRQLKMQLTDHDAPWRLATGDVEQLGPNDLQAVQALYARSYPHNWFDPKMLETDRYFGIRNNGELISIAGIHTHAPAQRVAVVGNVATHPAYRGLGLATATCARLCQELMATTDDITLNVAAGNAAAIACYEAVGFTTFARYEKAAFVRR